MHEPAEKPHFTSSIKDNFWASENAGYRMDLNSTYKCILVIAKI